MPNPDPEEDYPNVNYQLFGPEGPTQSPKWPNLGFVINYAKVTGTNIPIQIMEPFSPDQVPVISALARNFAISDAWSSVPSSACQTEASSMRALRTGTSSLRSTPSYPDFI